MSRVISTLSGVTSNHKYVLPLITLATESPDHLGTPPQAKQSLKPRTLSRLPCFASASGSWVRHLLVFTSVLSVLGLGVSHSSLKLPRVTRMTARAKEGPRMLSRDHTILWSFIRSFFRNHISLFGLLTLQVSQ